MIHLNRSVPGVTRRSDYLTDSRTSPANYASHLTDLPRLKQRFPTQKDCIYNLASTIGLSSAAPARLPRRVGSNGSVTAHCISACPRDIDDTVLAHQHDETAPDDTNLASGSSLSYVLPAALDPS